MEAVMDTPPIPVDSTKKIEISRATNEKSFMFARYIVTLGKNLVEQSARYAKKDINIDDGQTHAMTFDFPPDSEIGQSISVLMPKKEPNANPSSLKIAYKAISGEPRAEIQIQSNNGLSIKFTHQSAENSEDASIQCEALNDSVDVTDENILQKLKDSMMMMQVSLVKNVENLPIPKPTTQSAQRKAA